MMFVYENIDTVFRMDEGYVNELIIENKAFLRSFIENLTVQTQGGRGKGVLSIKDTPVDMARYAELLTTFVPFDINQKSLLTKICQAMEKQAMLPERFADTTELLQKIEMYADELAFDFPCELIYTKLSMGGIFKALGIEIATHQTSSLELLFDYMSLVREFDKDKLFVTIHLRSYFSDDEVTAFIQTVLGHDMKLLMIESFAQDLLPRTKQCIIDEDLCEI